MSDLNEIFDIEVCFKDVRVGVEFVVDETVYRKLSDSEADKVNSPNADNVRRMSSIEVVYISHLDWRI